MTTISRDKSNVIFAAPTQTKGYASRHAFFNPAAITQAALAIASALPTAAGAPYSQKTTQEGAQNRLPIFAEAKSLGRTVGGRRMGDPIAARLPSLKPHATENTDKPSRRSLLQAPESIAVYLVPKNTFSKTSGFKVLYGKGGIGHQAVLGEQSVSGAKIFNVQTDGQIMLNAGDNSQSLCLDVFGATYKNGSAVDVWPCNGNANQKWNFTDKGDDVYTLSPAGEPHGSHFCLDVAGGKTTDNTPIQLYKCHGGSNQQWMLISAG